MKKVFISLDSLNGRNCHSTALALLKSLNISTDYWGRTRAEISDEAYTAIRRFERQHSDNPKKWQDEEGLPFVCRIMGKLSERAYEQAHETPVQIGRYTEYSWQR